MKEVKTFEERAKEDTFLDIYRKIVPLIANEKYAEAQREIKKELSMLAGALGGSADERLRNVRKEFEVFLPEEVRWLLNNETSEARARAGRKKAEEFETQTQERAMREEKSLAEYILGPRAAEIKNKWMRSRDKALDVFTSERTWDIPALNEIKEGLIIEIQNTTFGKVNKYEIIGRPYKYKGGGY